jgi:hypothetical protein
MNDKFLDEVIYLMDSAVEPGRFDYQTTSYKADEFFQSLDTLIKDRIYEATRVPE